MDAEQGLIYVIDRDLCSGHGRCYTLAPDSFQPDEVDYGVVTNRVFPESERSEMQAMVASCPEQAISIQTVNIDARRARPDSPTAKRAAGTGVDR